MSHEIELDYPPIDNRIDAIEKIKRKSFIYDPREFFYSISSTSHPYMLTHYSIDDFSRMKTFKVPGYSMGFALKYDGNDYREIIGLHNNEQTIRNMGQYLLEAAIHYGGTKLDHFGSEKLNNLYESMGFIEVARDEFDEQYDPDGVFEQIYGKLPVIYRVLLR